MCRNEGINTPQSRENLQIDIQLAIFPEINRVWLTNSALKNSPAARELLLLLPQQAPSFEVWEKVDATLSDVFALAEQRPALLNAATATLTLLDTHKQLHWPFICLFLSSTVVFDLPAFSNLLIHFRDMEMLTEDTFSDIFKFLCRFHRSLYEIMEQLEKACLLDSPQANRFWQFIIRHRAHINSKTCDDMHRLLLSYQELNMLAEVQLASVLDLIQTAVSRCLAEKDGEDDIPKQVCIALREHMRGVQTLEAFNLTAEDSLFYGNPRNAIKLRFICELGFSFEMIRCFETDFLVTVFENIDTANMSVLKYFLSRGISLADISNHFLSVKPIMSALSKIYADLSSIQMLTLLNTLCDTLLLSRTQEGHFLDDNVSRITHEFQQSVGSFDFLNMPGTTKKLYQEKKDKLPLLAHLVPLVEFSRFSHRYQEEALDTVNGDNFTLLQHLKLNTTRFKFLLLFPCLVKEVDKIALLLAKYLALQTPVATRGMHCDTTPNLFFNWLADDLNAIDDAQCTIPSLRNKLNAYYDKLAAFDFPPTLLRPEITAIIRLDIPNFLQMLQEAKTSLVAFLHLPLEYQHGFVLRNPINNIITGHLYHHLSQRFPADNGKLWSLISNPSTLTAFNRIIYSLDRQSEDPFSERFLSLLTNCLIRLPTLSVDAILNVLVAINTTIVDFSFVSNTDEEQVILEKYRTTLLTVARLEVPLSIFAPHFLMLSATEKERFSSYFSVDLLPLYFLTALKVNNVTTEIMIRVFLQLNTMDWLKQMCTILSQLMQGEDPCPILDRIAKQAATFHLDIPRVLNYLKTCTEGFCRLQRLKFENQLLGVGLQRWVIVATEGRPIFNAFVGLIDRSNLLLLQTLQQSLPPFVFYLVLFNALPMIRMMLKHYADRLPEDAPFTAPQHTVAQMLTTLPWHPVREQTPAIVRGCLFQLCQRNEIPLPKSLQYPAQTADFRP